MATMVTIQPKNSYADKNVVTSTKNQLGHHTKLLNYAPIHQDSKIILYFCNRISGYLSKTS